MNGASKIKLKERVITVAGNLFYEQGFQATGINQIIESAGISKAGLYLNYKSKDDILRDYLSESSMEWFAALDDFISTQIEKQNKIVSLFEFRKSKTLASNYKGCAFIRIAYELPELSEQSFQIVQRHSLAIKDFIKSELIASHKHTESEIDDLADHLYNLYEGCGIQTTLLRSIQPINSAIAVVKKIIK